MNEYQLDQQRIKESGLTQDLLHKWFEYRPETGWLTWVKNNTAMGLGAGRGGCRRKDKRAGNAFKVAKRGRTSPKAIYRRVQIGKHLYLEHRLIWLHAHGYLPEWPLVLDHVNGDGTDNRLENLRIATRAQNVINTQRRAKSKTIWLEKNGKWTARLTIGGFETREQAAEFAYRTMKKFHGEFVNPEHYGVIDEPCKFTDL